MSEVLISYYEHPALSNAGGRRHGRRCRLSLLLRSYPVRWHCHSDPPPGGQPHSEGCSVSGPTGVLLQMSDIKLIPNAPKEKSNDR